MKRRAKTYSLVAIAIFFIGSTSVFGRISDSMPSGDNNQNFSVDLDVTIVSIIQFESCKIEEKLQNQTSNFELPQQFLTDNVKFIPGQSFVWRKNSIRSLNGFNTHLKI